MRGLVRRPCPVLGSGGEGRDGGLVGALLAGAAPPGADGLEQVVAGGPQVQFEVDLLVAVAEVGAEAGEKLGGKRLDDPGAPPGEGPAFGGIPPGGPLLPREFSWLWFLGVVHT